jgi:hypothetical protein
LNSIIVGPTVTGEAAFSVKGGQLFEGFIEWRCAGVKVAGLSQK